MRKVVSLLLVLVFLLAFGSVAFAMSDDGLCASPAFNGSPGHWTHDSGAPRFDTDNQFLAITGIGGHYANENSVIRAHGDESLVRAGEAPDAEIY